MQGESECNAVEAERVQSTGAEIGVTEMPPDPISDAPTSVSLRGETAWNEADIELDAGLTQSMH